MAVKRLICYRETRVQPQSFGVLAQFHVGIASEDMRSQEATNIRILIACSNLMAGRLLAQALQKRPELKIVGLASKNDDLPALVQRTKAQVCLVSTHANEGKALSILGKISEQFPKLHCIVLADQKNPDVVVGAFRAGARGVFSCVDFDTRLLVKCIRRVVEGQIWADTLQVKYLLEALGDGSKASKPTREERLSLLTAREETVVRLVAQGMSNRDIARHLTLSEHTIKNNLFRIFEKLGFSNRVELVLYAIARLNQAKFPEDSLPVPTIEAYIRPSLVTSV